MLWEISGEFVIRILVADDNPAVRNYLRDVLEQHDGWRVSDAVGDGIEAIRRFQLGRHDLIVLDFQMPAMNGLDVARNIARESPSTPILMVTLHISRQLCEEARRVGVKGACAKVDVGSLIPAVEALLREETYFPVEPTLPALDRTSSPE